MEAKRNLNVAAGLMLGLLLVVAASEVFGGGTGEIRIYRGKEVGPGEMPFMAGIFTKGENGFEFDCGGSIIDEWHVLTAAHCVATDREVLKKDLIQVQVGCNDLSECNSTRLRVAKIMVHPKFEVSLETDAINDLAIIRLEDKIIFDQKEVGKVHLATDEEVCCDEEQQVLTVAGWGKTEATNLSNILLKVEIDSIPLEKCKQFGSQRIDGRVICAGNPGRGSCNGDSGGPLLMTDSYGARTQVGIVSYGLGSSLGCGTNGGAYMKVAHYHDWIGACLTGYCKTRPEV